jgi:hypothetical protein
VLAEVENWDLRDHRQHDRTHLPSWSPQDGHNDVSEYFGQINTSLDAVFP